MLRAVLCQALFFYVIILWARVIFSFAIAFKPDLQANDGLMSLVRFVSVLTDPPVDFLRQFIPPLRSGAMALDLAFIAWFLIVIFIQRGLCG